LRSTTPTGSPADSNQTTNLPGRPAALQRAAADRARETPEDITMPIQHILLVDDSKTELAYLSDLLAKRGFTVRTAENGEEAMKRLAEGKPDLILMDVVMPGTNGYQLTRTITRDPRYADVPVIMCTSKGQETDRVWGLRQGARDYVVKPVDTEDLMAKIKALG
jgi:twitching motility two-component system response regulator PilH